MRDLVGRLLIVRPTEYVEKIATTFGEKDAIKVDFADLDSPDPVTGLPGVIARDVLWFNGPTVGSLKRQLGDLVLGRVVMTPPQPGKQPGYALADATGDAAAVSRAEAWIASNPTFARTVAAPASPPPAVPVPAAAPAAAAGGIPEALLAQLGPEARALAEQLAAQQRAQ
ncbi:hypothetical protein [Longispora albida]|uniref:hypothetical protein n=1 Tax=Longispora albida TaxID=203523 RepID=UPI000367D5DE|nr:hypothetical protein [Longispora albida]